MARDVLSSLASSRRRRFEREVFHLPGLPASYLEGEPSPPERVPGDPAALERLRSVKARSGRLRAARRKRYV